MADEAPKNGQPRPGISRPGLMIMKHSAKGPVSRILSCAVIPLGAALPRTLISDLPGGFSNSLNRLSASGRCAAPHGSLRTLPSLFGLAPCGVYLAPGVTAGAVRSYRTISPLPRRWSFRNGGRTRQAGSTRVLRFQGGPWPEGQGVAEAVSFLWHWPSAGFEAHVPDVIRHTALRSSDFPPPVGFACANPSGSDRPVLLPRLIVPRISFSPTHGYLRLARYRSLRFGRANARMSMQIGGQLTLFGNGHFFRSRSHVKPLIFDIATRRLGVLPIPIAFRNGRICHNHGTPGGKCGIV